LLLRPRLAQPSGSQPDREVPEDRHRHIFCCPGPGRPVFSDQERLALAEFLAGYTGLTREAYALDLRQFAGWVPAAQRAAVRGAAGRHRAPEL